MQIYEDDPHLCLDYESKKYLFNLMDVNIPVL